MPAASRGGRRATISRAAIEQAVIEVGFDRATTTAVAARLGVDQSSLYRHIDSKQAMVLGAINRVLCMGDWNPATDDWESYLRAIGETMWDVLTAHRGLASALYALDSIATASYEIQLTALRRLTGYGWTVPNAVLIIDTISDMTAETVLRLQGAVDFSELSRRYSESAPKHDALAREARSFTVEILADPRRWWERKLDLILAGAAHSLAPAADGSPRQ